MERPSQTTSNTIFFVILSVFVYLLVGCSLEVSITKGKKSTSNSDSPTTPDPQPSPTGPNIASVIINDQKMMFSTTASPEISWTAASEAGNGIQGYHLAIGTSAGGSEIMNWTNIGNILTTSLNSLTLQGSTRYYSSLKAIDNSGNASSVVQGDGWYNFSQSKLAVDNSPTTPRSAKIQSFYGQDNAISEDGSTLVVGAPYDATDASGGNYVDSAGSAFVYIKQSGSWVFQQKLVATGINSRSLGGNFGKKVSISGETIVIGSAYDSYDANGQNYVYAAGAAYVFTRTAGVWTQQQKLVATGTNARISSDYFGMSVSINGDTIVAGAEGQGYNEIGSAYVNAAGAAYVFARTAGVWTQQQKLVATGTNARISSDNFGNQVSVHGDTLAVGTYAHDYDLAGTTLLSSAGAVFVYTRVAGVWSQQQKIIATGTNARKSNDYFGTSVSIYADTLAIGASKQDYDASGAVVVTDAGAVFLFTRTAGVWSLEQKLIATGTNARKSGDWFGNSLYLVGDTVVIGATYHDYDATGTNAVTDSGAAFVYTRSTGTWTQQAKLVASGTNARNVDDRLGYGIGLGGDSIVLGAYKQDYNETGTTYVQDSGAAYAFSISGAYTQTQKLVDTIPLQNRVSVNDAGFGYSIAISEDGTTLAIGAPRDKFDANGENLVTLAGAVYVYIKQNGSWILQQKLVATGTNARTAGDYFGTSVDISQDTIVAGAWGQAYDENGANSISSAGAAYVFTRSAGAWTQQQKIVATGTNARNLLDSFGSSVSVSGDTVTVGAFWHDYDAAGGDAQSDAGAVFVYTRSVGVWSQQQKIVATGINARFANDRFGKTVAIEGNILVVGSEYHSYDSNGDNINTEAGAAFVFTRSAGVWSLQQKLIGVGTNARNDYDHFGSGVGISGETIIIGAKYHSYDENGNSEVSGAGAAYVFTRSAGVWTQQQKLVATGLNARSYSDNFGISVDINNNTITVGAPYHVFDMNGENYQSDAGAAFVFTHSAGTWTQQLKLVSTGTNARNTSDKLGEAVCVHENTSAGSWTIGITTSGQDYNSTGSNFSNAAGATFIYH